MIRNLQWFFGTDRGSKILLGVLLFFFAVYRLLLIQSGQLYWPDEYRYLHALHFLDELRQGDLQSGLTWVFGGFATDSGVASQPSYIFLSTVPAVFQGVGNLFLGIQPDDPSVVHLLPVNKAVYANRSLRSYILT